MLEARDRIGGRIESIYVEGQLIETAGQWVAPGHDEMHTFIEQAQLSLIPPSDGALLIRSGGQVIRSEPDENLDHVLTPFDIADLGQGVLRFQRLADKIQQNPVWASANEKWLAQPVIGWVATNLRTPTAQDDFKHILQMASSEPIDDLTLKEALVANASGLDLESLFAATGRLQQRRVAGGMFKVCEFIAAHLGDRIRLNTPVTGFDYDERRVVVHCENGEDIEARAVLNTVPPWLAHEMSYNPPLPAWREDIVNRTSPGSVIKAFVIYETPWWRQYGLSGQMSADEGLVQVTFDCTDDGKGVIMGFFEGKRAVSVANWTTSMRERAFIDALAAQFGPEARQAHIYVDRDWAEEKYSKGSHGAHFSPGIWTANGQMLSEPVGRIHFAGTEYAGKFNGYMEGAVRNARDEARIIMNMLNR